MTLLKKMAAIEHDLDEIKSLLKSQSRSKDQKEIITAHNAMEILDINRSTFDKWKSIGFIKVYKINRRLYVKYSELMQSLEEGLLERA